MNGSHARAAAVAAIAIVGSALALGLAGNARSTTGCQPVRGHLEADGRDAEPERMTGKIHGSYEYTFQGFQPSGNNPDVIYLEGRSVVSTPSGEIRFIENSAAAVGNQRGTNNATLMTVVGGTGAWEGASGFIALYGFFHTDDSVGSFDYRGEVCRND